MFGCVLISGKHLPELKLGKLEEGIVIDKASAVR
jgi:hypothetical protein